MGKQRNRFRQKNIGFKKRMLLIYIIGGIIPFLLATLYTNARIRAIMENQNKKSQAEEISLICSSISEKMRVADRVAEHLSNNEKVRQTLSKIDNKAYDNITEINKDCQDLKVIEEYEKYYSQEISSIMIYVENETITRNEYLSFINGRDYNHNPWYHTTYYRRNQYWYYGYDGFAKKNQIQVNRAVRDERGEVIGIVQISVQMNKINDKITNRSDNTMLLYCNEDIVVSNSSLANSQKYIYGKLKKYKEDSGVKEISYKVRDYILTYERIYEGNDSEYFTLVSIQNRGEMLLNITQTNFISISAVICGLFISVSLILIFSIIFENRLKELFRDMRHVARGEYSKVKPLDGSDEIALIYVELDKMMNEINHLTKQVVDEQVQKERLHTKQKEVEYKMLVAQINPHFIYNTLETIRMKAKINKQTEIEDLVLRLGKIMRRNIQAGAEMVTLSNEIELIENYLCIQKYRFGDRIQSKVSVDENVDLNSYVIPLIMQPFVENAFLHGLEAVDEGGKLNIKIRELQNKIFIEIKDNGAGINKFKLNEIRYELKSDKEFKSEHIGITNVNHRIKILYGKEYGVTIDSVEGKWTKIVICFPVKNKNI